MGSERPGSQACSSQSQAMNLSPTLNEKRGTGPSLAHRYNAGSLNHFMTVDLRCVALYVVCHLSLYLEPPTDLSRCWSINLWNLIFSVNN